MTDFRSSIRRVADFATHLIAFPLCQFYCNAFPFSLYAVFKSTKSCSTLRLHAVVGRSPVAAPISAGSSTAGTLASYSAAFVPEVVRRRALGAQLRHVAMTFMYSIISTLARREIRSDDTGSTLGSIPKFVTGIRISRNVSIEFELADGEQSGSRVPQSFNQAVFGLELEPAAQAFRAVPDQNRIELHAPRPERFIALIHRTEELVEI